jgi:hypothetical protein
MADTPLSIVKNQENASDWLTELAEELRPENDPTTKLCVVILTYDGNGMMRMRAHKMNAGVLEAVGMLSMAEADYLNQD